MAEALVYWRKGLRIEPDHQQVLNQAAGVLATYPEAPIRDGEEATFSGREQVRRGWRHRFHRGISAR
jgi:hypothetical protein